MFGFLSCLPLGSIPVVVFFKNTDMGSSFHVYPDQGDFRCERALSIYGKLFTNTHKKRSPWDMSTELIRIGLARMYAEYGERRDFLPSFVRWLENAGYQVVLEYGYGSGMGYSPDDYQSEGSTVAFATHDDVYQQDIVLVLRCPSDDDLQKLRPGSTLISMLHFPTRPERVDFLRSLGIEAISLDSITDDVGRRLVENLRAVAWNGLEVGFQVLHRTYPNPGLESSQRGPVHATILGIGAVGIHAVQAASRYGNVRLWESLAGRGVPGVLVSALDYDLTSNEQVMHELLSRTDILVDATQRRDQSQIIIPNAWIGWMPEHAVLVDLSVDPYDCDSDPPKVKGIEGIPQGNLDQYVFTPDDPAYERIPSCISTENRRHAVSCYSWPGIHPIECMEVYGKQIYPLLRTIIERGGVQNIRPKGSYFERALSRAMLSRWSG